MMLYCSLPAPVAPKYQLSSPEVLKLSSMASSVSSLPTGSTTPQDSDVDQPDFGEL